MPDTARSRSELQALLADNLVEAISAQDLRDFLASVLLISEIGGIPQELLYGASLAAPYDISPYAVTFDSTDGADGTVNSITIPFLLNSGAPLIVRVGRETYVPFADYTVAPSGSNTVVTFVSGTYPLANTIVTVIATPAVS